jgi:hypothetical protein
MALSRRRFIQAGLLGAGVLATAGAYEAWRLAHCTDGARTALTPAERALFGAMAPALLDGMVHARDWTPALRDETLGAIAQTVAGLPAHARHELRQFACLLDQAPLRLVLARRWQSWADISPQEAQQVLARWRFSGTPMLVSAYQAVHDITFGAWYAQPAHWAAIGYPGPPQFGATPT